MTAEKKASRLLGTRLSQIFNPPDTPIERKTVVIGRESDLGKRNISPLSAPKLLNQLNSSRNIESAAPATPSKKATSPLPNAISPRIRDSLDTTSLSSQLSPSRLTRKPPPADEFSHVSVNSSPQSKGSKLPRDAFAEMKNMVGNELDEIMASSVGISVPHSHLFVSSVLEEPTSPLHVDSVGLRKASGSPLYFSTHLEDSGLVPSRFEDGLHSLNKGSFDLQQNTIDMPTMPRNSSSNYSTPISENLRSPFDGLPPLLDPAYSDIDYHNRSLPLVAINEYDRPRLFLETQSGEHYTSSFDIERSPLSLGLKSHCGDDNTHSANVTPQMFSVRSSTPGRSDQIDVKGVDENGPQTPNSRIDLARHLDSLYAADSFSSQCLELPADSFSESLNHFATSTFATRSAAANFVGPASQLESPTYLEFSPSALESTTLETQLRRGHSHKLMLLSAWHNLQHSFSETVGSSQLMMSNSMRKSHTRVSSTSSITSTSSRHVNLATIKRLLSLRPGEGDRSNYVTFIRKSAGTSYNEAGPGKWKLPLGILPLDSKVMSLQSYTNSNARFARSGLTARSKRSSGVELKHGHLQPRLLAAEIDEVGDTNRFGSLGRSSTLQNKTPSIATTINTTNAAPTPLTSTPIAGGFGASSIASRSEEVTSGNASNVNSLTRSSTLSARETGTNGGSSNNNKSRRASGASFGESLNSVGHGQVDAYYQHQGYRYDEEAEYEGEYNGKIGEELDYDDDDEGEEKPQLVLANPDSSSDNE